jgi:endonuclease YncB( thermonuclease family)
MQRALIAIVLLITAPGPVAADMGGLQQDGAGVVVTVVDGDTLELDTGTVVRLVGLQAPKLPLGRKGFQAWPLADESKAALERLALNKRVTLSYGGARTDRYGRALAHLHDTEGTWIQGAMLRQGMARVYTFADNTALAADMLALEQEARAARRGIWDHPFYAIRDQLQAGRYTDSFQLVEGRVLQVATVRGRTYLNFGEDWKTDFTVFIGRKDGRRLRGTGFDPKVYEGRRVRVRGWLTWYDGPNIRVTHREQIEVLDE